jgi:pimeloyl-ACP methyl ester carboxylesterase
MDRFYTNPSGFTLRYRVTGKPESRTVVLIHGVGGKLEDWEKVAGRLEASYHVVRFDMRGHGQSDKPPGPYLLEQVASDLHQLLGHLNLEPMNLVGNSLGALVAQQFALTFPEAIETLTIVAGVAGRTEDERSRVLARLDIVENGISGQHFDSSVSRWYTDDFIRANPDHIERAKRSNAENNPEAYAAAYRMLATNDLADRLNEVRLPTSIVTGEFDIGSNPRMARLMHEKIAGSRLTILAGMKHAIVNECPDKVAQVIADNIESTVS